MDWFEALQPYLTYSGKIRRWFVENVFVQHRERFCEYLLECPSAEVGGWGGTGVHCVHFAHVHIPVYISIGGTGGLYMYMIV